MKGRQECQGRREILKMPLKLLGLEDGERGHETRNAGNLQKLEKILPEGVPKKHIPAHTLI